MVSLDNKSVFNELVKRCGDGKCRGTNGEMGK